MLFNLEQVKSVLLPKVEGDWEAQKALKELIEAYQAERKIKEEYFKRITRIPGGMLDTVITELQGRDEARMRKMIEGSI